MVGSADSFWPFSVWRFYACRIVAIRCQAVDSGARKPPPSGDRWLRRQVATATGGYGGALNRSHPLPSGGGECEEGFHRLATGGYGDRWLRGMHRCKGPGEGRIGPIGYNPDGRPSPLSPFGVWYQRCDRKNFAFGWRCSWSAERSQWLRKIPARRIPPGAFKPVCL